MAAQEEKEGGCVLVGVALWGRGPWRCMGLCCEAADRSLAGLQDRPQGQVGRSEGSGWPFFLLVLSLVPALWVWATLVLQLGSMESEPHKDDIIRVLLSEFCLQLKRKFYKRQKKNGSLMAVGCEVLCWDVSCALSSMLQATAVQQTQSVRGSAGWGCCVVCACEALAGLTCWANGTKIATHLTVLIALLFSLVLITLS